MSRLPAGARGFTLIEVMMALAILSLALLAIIDINGSAIRTHTYAKRVTIATMLARAKMVEIESEYVHEGFTSDFDQKMEGDFSDEGWEDFRWEAEIIKPDLDAGNASAMVSSLVGQLGGLDEVSDIKQKVSIGGRSKGPESMMAGMAAAAIGPMIETQVTMITATLEKAVREVRLRVIWQQDGREEDVSVATHLVVLAPAGQPGGEPLDGESAALASGARGAGGGGAGAPGGVPAGMTPGPQPNTALAPNGQLTGPGIPRPAWVPEWVPTPPYGARYNPGVQNNPSAPPFIWDVPMKD